MSIKQHLHLVLFYFLISLEDFRGVFQQSQSVAALAKRQVDQRYEETEMAYLAKLSLALGIPFSSRERHVIGHSGLAGAAIDHLILTSERGVEKSPDFWGRFYRTAIPPLSAAIGQVCHEFDIPPFMVTERSVKDAETLGEMLAKIRDRDLLWMVQNGIGKEWLRSRDERELDSLLQQMQHRVSQLRSVLIAFGVSDVTQQRSVIMAYVIGNNLNSIQLRNLAVLAQLSVAARQFGVATSHLQAVIDYTLLEGDTGIACRRMFGLFGEKVGDAIGTFERQKKEAMLLHAQSLLNLASLAMLPEDELEKRVAALAVVTIANQLPGEEGTIQPFREMAVRLCLSVTTDISLAQTVAERLHERWGFTQAVFDANPRLVYRQYQQDTLHELGAVRAFVCAAIAQQKEGKAEEAGMHLNEALRILANYPSSTLRGKINRLNDCWKKRLPAEKIIAELLQEIPNTEREGTEIAVDAAGTNDDGQSLRQASGTWPVLEGVAQYNQRDLEIGIIQAETDEKKGRIERGRNLSLRDRLRTAKATFEINGPIRALGQLRQLVTEGGATLANLRFHPDNFPQNAFPGDKRTFVFNLIGELEGRLNGNGQRNNAK